MSRARKTHGSQGSLLDDEPGRPAKGQRARIEINGDLAQLCMAIDDADMGAVRARASSLALKVRAVGYQNAVVAAGNRSAAFFERIAELANAARGIWYEGDEDPLAERIMRRYKLAPLASTEEGGETGQLPREPDDDDGLEEVEDQDDDDELEEVEGALLDLDGEPIRCAEGHVVTDDPTDCESCERIAASVRHGDDDEPDEPDDDDDDDGDAFEREPYDPTARQTVLRWSGR